MCVTGVRSNSFSALIGRHAAEARTTMFAQRGIRRSLLSSETGPCNVHTLLFVYKISAVSCVCETFTESVLRFTHYVLEVMPFMVSFTKLHYFFIPN